MSTQQTRFTIAELSTWPLAKIDGEGNPLGGIDFDMVIFTPEEAKATVAAWCDLLGADSETAAEAARAEVLSDAPLFVALNRPAAEFVTWWRGLAWENFPRSEEEGVAWAWAVLDRARQVAAGLGPMASQVSMGATARRLAAQ
jgi:hypothetical protein